MEASTTKRRVKSPQQRLRQLRFLLRKSFAEIRKLREHNARVFQRRLGQMQSSFRQDHSNELLFGKTLEECLEEFEHRAIELALDHSDNDLWEAAMLLGVLPDELHKKMERYGMLVSEEVNEST